MGFRSDPSVIRRQPEPHGMRDAKQSLSGSAAWHRAARCRGRGGHGARGAQQMFAISSARLCFLLGHGAPGLVLSSLEAGDPATALLLPCEVEILPGSPCRMRAAGTERALGSVVCQREQPPPCATMSHVSRETPCSHSSSATFSPLKPAREVLKPRLSGPR